MNMTYKTMIPINKKRLDHSKGIKVLSNFFLCNHYNYMYIYIFEHFFQIKNLNHSYRI